MASNASVRRMRSHLALACGGDSTAGVTAEVAVVASGSSAPDALGNAEFSVVMAWVKGRPGVPAAEVIDRIVNSALVHGGVPAP